jgi:hypothetical protein
MATTLNELINRMNVYTPVSVLPEVQKVNALDQAIRALRRKVNPAWSMKKSTLRVFSDVYLYPPPADQARIAILDDPLGQDFSYGEHPRYVYTSLRDFLEAPTGRNMVAEVWQSGQKLTAVRNQTGSGLTNQLAGGTSDAADWAGSGDAGTPTLDYVLFLTGPTSVRVPVTFSGGTATVTDTFAAGTSVPNYKAKYFFAYVYLQSVPTSVELRLRKDGSNYLSKTVSAQFAGQPFVANDWNTLAMDLDTATETGSTGGQFNSAQYVLSGLASGSVYFDKSWIRGWTMQDYWYYGTSNVLDGSTYQQFFAPDSATYSLTSELIGETVWHDAVMYAACLYLLSNSKEEAIKQDVGALWNEARQQLFAMYPDETPQISTNTYRFQTDYQADMGWPDVLIRG